METFGRYTLLELIGRGGMAEVFRAKSYGVEGFEKILVIKRILPGLAREPRFVDLFVREAKLAVRLSHANVVQVFDLGRVGEELFIAMEYVHGIDLATLLGWFRERGSQMTFALAAYVAAEVAKGLDHAHRRRDEQLRPLGIVHRDVSPQNVLLSYEGEVKVTDFGIAKAKDFGALGAAPTADDDERGPRSDGRVTIRGKFAYLSPEQAIGAPTDARCDVYALGVVLYEMLAGRNPFIAPTSAETLRRVRQAEAPPIQLARPDVPERLASIVGRAMARSPDQRFTDAARLHDELLGYLYASGQRFGAPTLASVLADYRRGLDETPQITVTYGDAQDDGFRTPMDLASGTSPSGLPFAGDDPSSPPSGIPLGDLVTDTSERGSAFPLAVRATESDRASRPTVELPTVRGHALKGAVARTSDPATVTSVRTVNALEQREVTLFVLEHRVLATGVPQSKLAVLADHVAAVLIQYGAKILEAEETRLTAIFGADQPDGRDTDAAVRSAFVLMRTLRDVDPSAAVGIHTGRVCVDMDGKLQLDERLSALRTGAHELARVRKGAIALSTTAHRHVRPWVEVDAIPDGPRLLASVSGVLVRGRRTPHDLWGKFIGRREELHQFGALLASATKRRAKLITVRGAPGIGKTRLLHEIHRRLERGGYDVGWYLATCTPQDRIAPLSSIAGMLRVLCDYEDGDPEAKLNAIVPRLRALGLDEDDVRTTVQLVRAGAEDLPSRGAEAGRGYREHVGQVFARMLVRLSQDRLHVLAWDDAQLMDAASREALALAARSVAGQRLVLMFATSITASRAEGGFLALPDAPDGRGIQSYETTIAELNETDLVRLIASRLQAREVAAELVQFVAKRAGGNPQFVEELVRAMEDGGAIGRIADPSAPPATDGQRRRDRVYLRRNSDGAGRSSTESHEIVDLPKSLRGLMAERIARRSPSERALLTAMALLGEPAEIEVLVSALEALETEPEARPNTSPATLQQLAALEAAGLIRREGTRSVAFVSPASREAVLDAATGDRKRTLHRALAKALRLRHEPAPERIATHLLEGGRREDAATFFAQAAEQHLEADRADAAARCAMRALTIAELRSRPAEAVNHWLTMLVQSLSSARALPGQAANLVTTAIEQAVARMDGPATPEQQRDTWIAAARAYGAMAEFSRAKEALGRAEGLVRTVRELSAEPVSHAQAEVALIEGDFASAIRHYRGLEAQLGSAAPRQSLTILLGCAMCTAAVRGPSGRPEALEYLGRANAVARTLTEEEDPRLGLERAKAHAFVLYACRALGEAETALAQAVEMARTAGLANDTGGQLVLLGDCRLRLGDLSGAGRVLYQALTTAEENAYERLFHAASARLAYIEGLSVDGPSGEINTALDRIRDHVTWSEERGLRGDEATSRYWLAALLAHGGQNERARAQFERARQQATRVGFALVIDDCDRGARQLRAQEPVTPR